MPMVDVKSAVRTAAQFLLDIQPSSPPEDVAVEEVELSEDEGRWLVTLGFYPPGSSISRVSGDKPARQYREIQVDADLGGVLSMKMRKV